MAKNRQNTDELEISLDDVLEVGEVEDSEQNVEDNVDKEPEINIETESLEQEAPGPKKVKIRVKKPHRCNIGGVWYDLHPNKEIPVPANVRDILRNAGNILEG